MWNKKVLTKTIKDNLSSGNFEAVESACRIAFEKGGLSESEKRFIKSGFVSVAEDYHYKSQLDISSIIYEYARILNPDDTEIVLKQINIFNELFNVHVKKFVYDDLLILDAIISILMESYKSPSKLNKFAPAIEIEIDLRKRINKRLKEAQKKEESPLSYRLQNVLNTYATLKFSNLTPEERTKEVTKYLSKGLRRVIKKEQSKPIKKSK